jgi:hypothetical protein
MNRIQRLEHALASLTRAFHARKAAARPYAHLLPRCRVLSAAWLEARHEALARPGGD